jgi:hypothetical protein
MTGYEVYKLYVAIKLHFTSNHYNYFSRNGKVKVTQESFDKRKDKYYFKTLARKFNQEQLIYYFVAHFVDNKDSWIGDIYKIKSSMVYDDWLRKIQSMAFVFSNDLDTLLSDNSFEDIFKVVHTHPPVITKYLGKSITIETVVILNYLLNFIDDLNDQIIDPVVWPEIKKKVVKYEPFLSIDKPKYKQIVLSKVSN